MPVTIDLTAPPLAAAALHYAEQGLAVLPLEPGGKRPLRGLSWEDASADPVVVANWWKRQPRANIGLRCANGRAVLDVDGLQGETTLEELGLELPATHEVITGRQEGGRHLHFATNGQGAEGWRSGGLELKTKGYVLMPPSVHPDTGAWYWAAELDAALAPLPERLARNPKPETEVRTATRSGDWDAERQRRYSLAALEDEVAKLAAHSREPQTGRDTALYAAACAGGRHQAAGGLAEAEVWGALMPVGRQLGLPEDRIQRQIQRGLEEGAADPAWVPEAEPRRVGSYVLEETTAMAAPRAPVKVPLFDMAQAIADAAEPLPWMVEPLAARGYLTVLVGRPEAFKSWLMLMLGHQVHIGGGELAGLRCSAGVGLYVDAENGARLMGARYRLGRIPADGLLVADGSRLRLPQQIDHLRSWVEQTGATLLVIDSLRRVAVGMREKESDDATPVMAALADLARELHCAVVVIHHRSTKRNAEDVRGSSVLEDQADVVWVLERVPRDPEHDRRRLRRRKFRIGAPPANHWLRVAFPEEGLELSEAEPYAHAAEDGTDDMTAAPQDQGEYIAGRIRLLADQVRTEGEEHGWRPAQLAAAVGLDAQHGTFKRAIGLLLDAGEWVAEGSTKARRYRPAIQANQATPIGDGLSGLNQPTLPGTEEPEL